MFFLPRVVTCMFIQVSLGQGVLGNSQGDKERIFNLFHCGLDRFSTLRNAFSSVLQTLGFLPSSS